MPGTERTDVVARYQFAADLADQVDFKFGMVVPARQVVGVVMLEPAEAMVRLGQDHFEFGGAVLEQLGAADGHGGILMMLGIASKYAPQSWARYSWFRQVLILF